MQPVAANAVSFRVTPFAFLSRRAALASGLAAWLAPAATATPTAPLAFTAETPRALAEALARAPFVPLPTQLPTALRALTYDAYRRIRFDRAQAWWADAGLPFQLQPFHRGFLFAARVELFEVADGTAQLLRYRVGQFRFDGIAAPPPDADLGFAGARVLCRLNRADHFDEVAAFVGASYFRAVSAGQVYGVSARGLAIGTADARGEEFPAFRAFWFERPAPDAARLVVHALLDSPSASGACRFVITPGRPTTIDVETTLFARAAVATLGIAPGTSMFLFGPGGRAGAEDFRASVFDSEGLLMRTGGGAQPWRPLDNPRALQVSGFADHDPQGFGLLQRQRDFHAFHDLEAHYHRRPGLWVEPLDPWGRGEVQLVEIPTDAEIHDNIVAFWRPAAPLLPGMPQRFAYRLHWTDGAAPGAGTLAAFAGMRTGAGSTPRARRFVLELAGADIARRAAAAHLDVWASVGELRNPTVQANDATGGVRIAFELLPGNARLVELGAELRDADGPISERWLYRWTA